MQPELVHHSALVGEVTLVLSAVLGLAGALVLWVAFSRSRRITDASAAARSVTWLAVVDLFGAALFCALAHAVVLGASAHLDRGIELGIHRFDTPTLDGWMHAFTAVGSVPGLSVIVGTVAVIALALRRWRVAAAVVTVALTSAVLIEVLKNLFGRLRPQLFTEIPPLHSFSFPSGHSFGSSAVFATLAVVVAGARPKLAWVAFVAAALLSLAIGLSRIYLGVHWPSDVLAGFLLGSLLALNAAVWLTRAPPHARASAIER